MQIRHLRAAGWALALAACAVAQTDQATLRGTATDPTGAVVVAAKIELTNIDTNAVRSVLTNEDGDYEIPYINPGNYRLSASAAGFRTFVARDVILFARETRRLNVNLELGQTGVEVTVSAGAAVIATEGSQIAATVTHDAWVDGPTSATIGFPQTYLKPVAEPASDAGRQRPYLRFPGQVGRVYSTGYYWGANGGRAVSFKLRLDF